VGQLAKAPEVDSGHGPGFTDASMLIQAAVAGQGVALARAVLARDEIRQGRLVRLFEQHVPIEQAYYLVYPPRLICDQ
jgi:LysR family transcriptional regulator, glycine cleavage system transcriptional activator